MAEVILELDKITKHYRQVTALDCVSLQIRRGEVFGLLGRNGGGKTTLIKIITSTLFDYLGDALFLGRNMRDKTSSVFFKERIAFLPDRDFLYGDMNGLQLIRFFKDFFPTFNEQKAMEIFKKLDVNPAQVAKTMSKGQAEKLSLSLILARDADLYIFDEPLAGADVISRDEIFKIIGEYSGDGAMIIATHLISSAEPSLTHAAFLNGKVMAQGSKEELLCGFKNLEDSFRYYAADQTIKPLRKEDESIKEYNNTKDGNDD